MTKFEGELKQKFTREFKDRMPGGFYLLQYATNGAPDREVVGAGITTRWEMKHGTPSFESPGDQELMCCRLAAVAHCRYVIWQLRKGIRRTMIVHPNAVRLRTGWDLIPEAFCTGFDMRWLVEQIRMAHERAR